MDIFNLPQQTQVDRVVPKNSFDRYATPAQKRQFADKVQRIKWSNKISTFTTNLPSDSIDEIQIFHIELKIRDRIPQVLQVIEKAIPYRIIFIVEHIEEYFLSTSEKHKHTVNEDEAVIDWTFFSEWKILKDLGFRINLKGNIDQVHKDFCLQLCGTPNLSDKPMSKIIDIQRKRKKIEHEIQQLKQKIKGAQSFKLKVEYNLQLKEKESELQAVLSKNNLKT